MKGCRVIRCACCCCGLERDRECIGKGELASDIEDRAASYDDIDALESKSLTSCCSKDGELDDRAEAEKSSPKEVRREEADCMRVIPKRLGRCRKCAETGSLSTVAKDMTESLPTLCRSDEDIE